MKKILVNIFLLLIIYPISKLDICEEKNSLNDCIEASTSSKYKDYCCYLDPLYGSGSPKCKTVPYSSYFTGYKRDYIDGTLYNVTCKLEEKKSEDNDEEKDENKTYALERCGDTHKEVKSLKDCKKYSSFVDSCCYFSNEKDDKESYIDFGEQEFEKGCYWLGSKYEGKIKWAGITLECQQNYLNYYIFSLYFFVSIFLF